MREIMVTIDRKVDKIGRLLQFASQGDVQSVKMLLDEGLPVDSPDYDGRTAMHLAACGGHYDVIRFLLKEANPTAHVNPVDRWRKTPLADARWYMKLTDKPAKKAAYQKICMLLNDNGGSTSSPFQLDPDELNFLKDSIEECVFGEIYQAIWRGTKVSARIVNRMKPYEYDSPKSDSDVMRHLSLLQSCRHPNIVQFLGAVTNYNKCKSLVLVTEYLPNGNLHDILHCKKTHIQPKQAVAYALDIARGMNYLHQHKPENVIHSELNPMNLVRDQAGSLKVSGINMSKLITCICTRDGDRSEIQRIMYTCKKINLKYFDYTRYQDPALDKENPKRSSDVYSFGMIIWEMFEGTRSASRPAQVVATNRPGRHMFRIRASFPPQLRELVEECCNPDPKRRPPFEDIIETLEDIQNLMKKASWWAPKPLQTFVDNVSYKSRLCLLGARKFWEGSSITPQNESSRGMKSRRGAHGQKEKMVRIPEEGVDQVPG